MQPEPGRAPLYHRSRRTSGREITRRWSGGTASQSRPSNRQAVMGTTIGRAFCKRRSLRLEDSGLLAGRPAAAQLSTRRGGTSDLPKRGPVSSACQLRRRLKAEVIPIGWNSDHLRRARPILQAPGYRSGQRGAGWLAMAADDLAAGYSAGPSCWILGAFGVPGRRISAPRRPWPRPLDRYPSHDAADTNG